MQASKQQLKIIMSVCSLIVLDGDDATKLPASSDAILPVAVADITGSPDSDGSDFWANEVASFEHQASPKKVTCVVT